VHLAHARTERREVERPRFERDPASEEIRAARRRVEEVGIFAAHDGRCDPREPAHRVRHAHPRDDPPLVVDQRHGLDFAALGERLDQVLKGFLSILTAFRSSLHGPKRIGRFRRGPNFHPLSRIRAKGSRGRVK